MLTALVGLRSLALIEVMDQFDPALRQRLLRDPVVVGAQTLADQSQYRCVLHGVLQDVQDLMVNPIVAVRFRTE